MSRLSSKSLTLPFLNYFDMIYGSYQYILLTFSSIYKSTTYFLTNRVTCSSYRTCRFFNLVKLKHLDVSRNRLEKLPDDITKCPVLERLIVHRNKLIAFPAEMNNLRLLRYIDASYNNISHVGLELEMLSNLAELNLGHKSSHIPSRASM